MNMIACNIPAMRAVINTHSFNVKPNNTVTPTVNVAGVVVEAADSNCACIFIALCLAGYLYPAWSVMVMDILI